MRDDVLGLSAELAYRFFLALFPFTIFITALGGFIAAELPIDNPAQRAVELLGNLLPPEAASLVESELRRIIDSQSAGLLSLGAILALFFATGGMNAIIKAMNRAYRVPEARPVWKRYLVALALTMVAGTGIVAAFVLFVPLRMLGPALARTLGAGELAGPITNTVAALGAFVLLIAAVSIVYRVAPNIRLPLRAVLPGAVLFAVTWLVATFGFGFYVSNFGNYANTYGALAGVAVMLIWFYVSALMLLVAAEVNEVMHEMADPADVQSRRREAERGEENASADDAQRRAANG